MNAAVWAFAGLAVSSVLGFVGVYYRARHVDNRAANNADIALLFKENRDLRSEIGEVRTQLREAQAVEFELRARITALEWENDRLRSAQGGDT